MKIRAPRNRTLTINENEKAELLASTITLNNQSKQEKIVNKIINQDFFQCAEFLPRNFIDLLIVDPPYNLSKTYGNSKFQKTSDETYAEFTRNWIEKIIPSLKSDASIYVCCDWQSSSIILAELKKHFTVRNRITWEREKGRGAKTNWKNCSEDIWFCTVSEKYYFNVDKVKLKKKVIAPYKDEVGNAKDWVKTKSGNFRLTHPSNLWTDISIPFWSMPENTDHPTQKPEKLIAKLILATSKKGDIVFDPFLGSGTTAVVANKLGRNFVAVEQEQEYCQLAAKRLIRAKSDNSIQGYHDGYFWERNSLSEQKRNKPNGSQLELIDE